MWCFPFERAISILVASCPCALGLAVPSVVVITLNLALKSGIVVKKVIEIFYFRILFLNRFLKLNALSLIKQELYLQKWIILSHLPCYLKIKLNIVKAQIKQ